MSLNQDLEQVSGHNSGGCTPPRDTSAFCRKNESLQNRHPKDHTAYRKGYRKTGIKRNRREALGHTLRSKRYTPQAPCLLDLRAER